MVSQAAWRLAHQPPSLMLDEYRSKMERVDGSDIAAAARERWLGAKVGEGVFWARVAAEERGAPAVAAVADPATSNRDRTIARGLKGMGIGLLIFGVGAVLASSGQSALEGIGPVGLVVGTVGAIWFLVGFLILLVGLLTPGEKPAQPVQPAPR
jgi:hypothetical protein